MIHSFVVWCNYFWTLFVKKIVVSDIMDNEEGQPTYYVLLGGNNGFISHLYFRLNCKFSDSVLYDLTRRESKELKGPVPSLPYNWLNKHLHTIMDCKWYNL